MSPYSHRKKKLASPGGRKKGMYLNMLYLILFSHIPNKRDSKSGKEMQNENNNLFNTPRFFAHL